MIGQTLGHYRIEAKLGEGGMGVVYRATRHTPGPPGRHQGAAPGDGDLHQEPEPITGDVAPELEKIVARCLRKDPVRRLQHMDDVKLALEDLNRPLAPLLERSV